MKQKKKWTDDFKDKIYYSHDKTNSCGGLITIYGNLNNFVKNKVIDIDSRVITLEATTDGFNYLLNEFI